MSTLKPNKIQFNNSTEMKRVGLDQVPAATQTDGILTVSCLWSLDCIVMCLVVMDIVHIQKVHTRVLLKE